MHSFLIIGSSPEKRTAEARARAETASSGVDLITIENPKGIDSAREIKSHLTRKPYQSKAITIILQEAQTLTIEAQNALLKTLEEPPGSTQIYITAPDANHFLPTVLSRTHLIDLGPLENTFDQESIKKAWELWRAGRLSKFFDATDFDPTIFAAIARTLLFHKLGVKEKEVTIILGEKELKTFANQLQTADLQELLHMCQHISELLDKNVNRKLAMENLFLKLPQPETKTV